MALVDRGNDDREQEQEELDLHRFNDIIDEYSSSFKNPPKSTHQLVQFCSDKQYNYKYGELNPFFAIWNKQQSTKTTSGGRHETDGDEAEIDWTAFWDEYQAKYQYPPKKAVHLWNFAKEDKNVSVKYKEARIAFDSIYNEKNVSSPSPIEGRTRSNTDLGLKRSSTSHRASALGLVDETQYESVEKGNKIDLYLKVTKYTSSADLEEIKSSFLDLLNRFRHKILHDPVSPIQLFNFINEDTEYKVRYGDVKKCYNFAVKHKWFVPMKRMKKCGKKKKVKKVEQLTTSEGSSSSSSSSANEAESGGEGVEYVLAVDHEKLERERLRLEEEKKEQIVHDVMTDDQFDGVLIEYNKKYANPPRNASQIMNFAKEETETMYKYKACRIAFNRWKNIRGAQMPKVVEMEKVEEEENEDEIEEEVQHEEPGKVEQDENEREEEEESEDDEEDEDEQDSD